MSAENDEAMSQALAIEAAQERYAQAHDLTGLTEALALHLVMEQPPQPLQSLEKLLRRLEERVEAQHGAGYGGACLNQGTAVLAGILDLPKPGFEVDSEANVSAYLEEHNVCAVLDELFAALLFNQPPSPLSFLADECCRLRSRRGGKGVTRLWTDEELATMHALADSAGRGVISRIQAQATLRSLGLRRADVALAQVLPISGSGGESAGVTAAAFVRVARAAMDTEIADDATTASVNATAAMSSAAAPSSI